MNARHLLVNLMLLSNVVFAESKPLGREEMGILLHALPNMTLERLHQVAYSNEFLLPPIRSPWSVTNIVMDYSERNRAIDGRDLGGALFLRIEDWAVEMKAAKPAAQPVKQFMDLTDWLMKSPGYGNFFMAKRCHEIATREIARALVDTNCPLDSITNQFPRFDAWWKMPTGRAKILNDDVGARLFEVPSDGEKLQQQYLDRMWAVGKTMVYKYSSPEVQAAFEGHPPPGYEDISTMVRQWYLSAYETPFMREHVSFFKDDGKVSAKNWNVNDHEALIVPYAEPQLLRLKCLAEFRLAIGYFPGVGVPNEDSTPSEQKTAFIQAWLNDRAQKGLREDTDIAVTAWEVYSDIMDGNFPE